MPLPKWYALALAERGVKEAPGAADNEIVQAYYKDAGHPEVKHDSVPWCAAFVGAMLARAGKTSTGSLAARSYLSWGEKLMSPRQGCVVVLKRGKGWQGHVTFFDREENGRLICLGGNQSDSVSFAAYRKSLVLGYRWPSQSALPRSALLERKSALPARNEALPRFAQCTRESLHPIVVSKKGDHP